MACAPILLWPIRMRAGGFLWRKASLCRFRMPAFAGLRVCAFYGALFVDEKQFGNLRVRVCTRVFTPLIFIMWTRESTCALGFRPFRTHLFVRVRVTND